MDTAALLSALGDDSGWYDRGRCVQDEADPFFERHDELGRSQREAQAKSLCVGCPVLAQCREWALAAGDLAGVWAGGTSTAERLAFYRPYPIAS